MLSRTAHPGRYTTTVGAEFTGPDDPLLAASARVLASIAAVLRGYGVGDDEMDHAIRTIRCTIHGFAALQAVWILWHIRYRGAVGGYARDSGLLMEDRWRLPCLRI